MREQPRGKQSRWARAGSSIAPIVVAFALVSLVAIPVVNQHRMRQYAEEVSQLAEPCRYLLDVIGVTSVTQARMARGAIFFAEEPAARDEYERMYESARRTQTRALDELLQLTARLGGDTHEASERLYHRLQAWQVRHRAYFDGELSRDEYARSAREQDQLYRSAIDEWSTLGENLRGISERRRLQGHALVERQALITSSLALLALVALLLVLWLSRRGRLLESTVQLRELAERVSAARAEVLEQVSHDLRSPLTAILTSCALVRRAPGGETPVIQRAMDRSETAARRMSRLVGDLLDHARLTTGEGLGMNAVDLDIGPVLLRCRDEASPERPERVALDVDEQARRVVADPDRLEQVLMNLIGNAIKFSPPAAPVRVEVRAHDDESVITVHDEGPGISDEDRPHLFEPFWQSARTRRPGYGLGLPIARAIVEAHGGHIWLESASDSGSTFAFTLPRA